MTTTFLTTLWTMTVAATVAALGVMVLRRLLKGAPRWITCALWLVVLFRMVCPVSFQAPVSLTDTVTERVTPAAVIQAEEPAQTTVETPQGPAVSPETPAPVPEQTAPVEPILFVLWALGAGGMLLWGVLSYGRLREKVSEAVLTGENIYETDQVEAPFVCGFLRPRIYLPVGLSDQDRAYVLLHEQAHIRRRDYLTKPLAWLALCLHWFNPILWLSYRLYCRDVETACDQAVVRDLDRDHTAGYAAALLHLGRKTRLPQAVPLAFGEEDAKGRIQGVLDYKKPRFWVLCTAILACIAGAVFLLADETPARDWQSIEGIGTTQAMAMSRGAMLELPLELGADLVALLNEHGHLPYEPLEDHEMSEHGVYLSEVYSPKGSFIFEPYTLTLIRDERDGGKDMQAAQMEVSLAQDPDYLDWLARFTDFQHHGWADAMYEKKTDSVGNTAAVGALLDAAAIGLVSGTYPLEYTTDPENGSIAITLDQWPPFRAEQEALEEYLHAMNLLVLALIGDGERISYTYSSPYGDFGAVTYGVPEHKGLTKGEFQALYQQLWDQEIPGRHGSYDLAEVVYTGPGVGPETLPPGFLAAGSTFEPYTVDHISPILYDRQTTGGPVTAEDGRVLLDPAEAGSAEVIRVMDETGQFVGYTLYRLDGKTWVTFGSNGGRLDYLVRVEPAD